MSDSTTKVNSDYSLNTRQAMDRGDVNITFDFLFGGSAVFTVSTEGSVNQGSRGSSSTFGISDRPQRHFTFQVTKADNCDDKRIRYFVGVLKYPQERDRTRRGWTYIGMLLQDGSVRLTPASKYSLRDIEVQVLVWAVGVLLGNRKILEGYRIQHEGKCGRCGRELTHPESLKTGIGPECRKKMEEEGEEGKGEN